MRNFFSGWSNAAKYFFLIGSFFTSVFLILYRIYDWQLFLRLAIAAAGVMSESYICRKLPSFLFYLPLGIFFALFSIVLITTTGGLSLFILIPFVISFLSIFFIVKFFIKKQS